MDTYLQTLLHVFYALLLKEKTIFLDSLLCHRYLLRTEYVETLFLGTVDKVMNVDKSFYTWSFYILDEKRLGNSFFSELYILVTSLYKDVFEHIYLHVNVLIICKIIKLKYKKNCLYSKLAWMLWNGNLQFFHQTRCE